MKNLKRLIEQKGMKQIDFGIKMYPQMKSKTRRDRMNINAQVTQLSKLKQTKYEKAAKILDVDFNELMGYESES